MKETALRSNELMIRQKHFLQMSRIGRELLELRVEESLCDKNSCTNMSLEINHKGSLQKMQEVHRADEFLDE